MQSRLKQKQRGATFLGILTIGSIVGLAVYSGIRLVPLYLDNMAVMKALNDTAKVLGGGGASPSTISDALYKRWTVDYISTVQVADIEISPVPTGLEMRAAYEARAPFIANISFVVEFDKAVIVKSGGGL